MSATKHIQVKVLRQQMLYACISITVIHARLLLLMHTCKMAMKYHFKTSCQNSEEKKTPKGGVLVGVNSLDV